MKFSNANGKVFEDTVLQDIAFRFIRTIPQVVLRWIVQHGLIALSTAVSET